MIRSATKLTGDLIERAERLKVIGRAGVGVDNVDVEAATRRGIVVANAPESTVTSAAEHTIGLLAALARNIPQAHAALKQGVWERSAWGGVELEGKTLGVLGFGRIGQQVARRALGLGMRVVAYDPFVAKERFRELGVERAETEDEALAAAEFVTPAPAAHRRRRRAILGREAIAKLPDGARLINAARGELVDEEALVEALRSGKLAAAALDVFSEEPYSGPLLELDNVVVTPHLAASTEEAQDRAGRDRRRAGRRRARGRRRHERGQHPLDPRRGSRAARAVHPARGEARPAGDGARRRAAPSGSRSRTTAPSPATTRACSPSPR